MSAADRAMLLAIEMMKSSTPNGNTWPRNEAEWAKAVAATEQMGYAIYLEMGMPEAKARSLAHAIHGGKAGRLLLQIAFDVDKARYG